MFWTTGKNIDKRLGGGGGECANILANILYHIVAPRL